MRIIKKVIQIVPGIFLLALMPLTCYSQSTDSENFNLNKDAVIIEGYDVVSYFMGSVSRGNAAIKANHNGAEFRFNTEENKDIFLTNPEKFVPAYGGWCAFAMGDSGKKVKIDPKTYKVIDGKLYLFYNFYFNNTLIDWNEDEKNLKEKADNNWLKINQE